MKRIVNRDPIDRWVEEHRPDGEGKLARAVKIPATSLAKIRQGRVPLDETRRQRLARKLGLAESELFPVQQDKEEAS